jgi:hypothetical protein
VYAVVRSVIAVCAAAAFLAGILLLLAGGSAAPYGIWPLVAGGVGLIAVVLERQRYRSEASDRGHEPTGPGGGEPAPLPTSFRPTEERFVDPTSGRVMRVFVDDRSGERRYRAEA